MLGNQPIGIFSLEIAGIGQALEARDLPSLFSHNPGHVLASGRRQEIINQRLGFLVIQGFQSQVSLQKESGLGEFSVLPCTSQTRSQKKWFRDAFDDGCNHIPEFLQNSDLGVEAEAAVSLMIRTSSNATREIYFIVFKEHLTH